MTALIDSHTHLESFHRAGRLDEILARAEEAGVAQMISVGTDPEDWQLYQNLARARPAQIAYTVGIHPCHVDENWENAAAQIHAFFQSETPPVALGEIGLDRFHLNKNPEIAEREIAHQKSALRAQLQIAKKLNLPIVIHSRGAFQECVDEIDASGFPWEKVVFHCFTEGESSMQILRERGGRGSFTGVLTYKKAEEVRQAALFQGLEHLMIETDAPYLAPAPHRGKPNEPAYLAHTAAFAADLFKIPLQDLATRTTKTTQTFFNLP